MEVVKFFLISIIFTFKESANMIHVFFQWINCIKCALLGFIHAALLKTGHIGMGLLALAQIITHTS